MKQRTKKTTLFALIAIVGVLTLSACGNNNNNSSSSTDTPAASSENAPANSPAASGETKEITVSATNFEFDTQEIKAKVGDTIVLTLKNDNGNHGLAIKDLGVDIKNGESATIVLDQAGTFEFNCSIMCGSGHDNMAGQLIVE